MGRPAGMRDPLKRFITTTWGNIHKRPGKQVLFSRREFSAWCEQRRWDILLMYLQDIPSIDRIDPWGHYEMNNIRIIPLRENAAQGGEVKCLNKTQEMERLYAKPCIACGTVLERKQYSTGKWEPTPSYRKRRTCGKSCSMVLRNRNENGRME